MCDATMIRSARGEIREHTERPAGTLVSSYRARAATAIAVTLAFAGVLALPATAQQPAARTAPQNGQTAGPRVLAYTLDHQPAADAIVIVRGMLSPMGTVELQPGGNTLVVRDHQAVLGRVETALGRFDHPPRTLLFDIRLLRASNRSGRAADASGDARAVPEAVIRRLREHLKFAHYDLLADVPVTALEGQEITYSLGSRYGVSFRPGSMIEEALRLHGFRIVKKPPVSVRSTNKSRQPEPREMIQADINLLRDKQFTLILSEGQRDGEALAVVITFRPEAQP